MVIEINSKKTNFIIIPVYEEKKKINFLDKKKREDILKELKDYPNFEGKKEQVQSVKINKIKYLLLGISKEPTTEEIRRIYSTAYNIVKQNKITETSLEIHFEKEEQIKAIIEGLDLTNYKFDKYISKKKDNQEIEPNFYLDVSDKFSKLLNETLLVNSNVKIARDLVNENASIITPQKLEEIVKNFARKNKLKFKSLDEKQIAKEKLNLLLSVGQGAKHSPRLIICEYNGNPKSKEKIALIGKGITFDTGGLNLKPTGYIEDMKIDMGGSATVYAAFKTAVELKLKKNIILVITSAENAISGSSYKPGDIITSYSGKSVEIGNTDAEGRLVLADALTYVQKHYKPTNIIDLATLTGAILVALGPKLIGMFGNDKDMKDKLYNCGEETQDRVWELPIYDEHRDAIKSKFADLKNIGGKYGGSITAAAFLENFIEKDVKWIHLDIAGAARSYAPEYYVPEFGTGRGVRLLVEYLKK